MMTARKLLIITSAFLAVSAIAGGIGVATNSLGLRLSDLGTSPFPSYLIPGLILLVVFGGTQTLAAVWLWRRHRLANLAAAIAGFGALIWIFVEMYVTTIKHWLQIAVFALGILELSMVFVLLKILPDPKKS